MVAAPASKIAGAILPLGSIKNVLRDATPFCPNEPYWSTTFLSVSDSSLNVRLSLAESGYQSQRYAKSAGRMGRRRMRLPVAAKMALQTAGAMPGVLASPMPPGLAWLGTMWTSTLGISSMRTTS